jgi:hypothetical protein
MGDEVLLKVDDTSREATKSTLRVLLPTLEIRAHDVIFALDYSFRIHTPPSLQIQITQTPIQSTHHLTNSSRLSSIAHIKNIVEPSLPRRRLVGPSHMTVLTPIHLLLLEATATEIEQLPRSPQTIHLAVVDPKRGIGGRGE